ncbi:MAG: hypothetical protein LBD58_07840 [Treponema sp.]|nr:hypothetical protein [Treponema sp.]
MIDKPCGQGQARLIPPGAGELVPGSRLARLAGEVTDETDVERLVRKRQAGGGAFCIRMAAEVRSSRMSA